MRICLFTPTFLPKVGGTEVVTDALARRFHAAGHPTTVLAQGSPEPLDVPYPVRWYPKPLGVKWWPERTSRSLRQLHAAENFDVICVNYANPTGYGAVRLGQAVGVPVVVVSHGGDLYRSSRDRTRPRIWSLVQYTYRHADGYIAISPYIEQLIREINPHPDLLEYIPNGIDLVEITAPADRPADYDDDRPFILCLGNLGPMKGFDDAIAAYARRRDELGDTALLVVGSGELGPALQRQAGELGLQEHVRFMGKRVGNDKRWFLQHCRFGVMPSIEEGHPIVGLEFLACGKPLVCTTNAAFDGMYEQGVNAYRVPPRSPQALGDALVTMHRADLAAMGEASRQRALGYSWDAIAQRYLDFFRRVVEGYRCSV